MSVKGSLIVGAGLMGYWHAHCLDRLRMPILGVVDTNEKKAQELANRFQARPFSRCDEALSMYPGVPVHICSPSANHQELIRLALDHHSPSLVEKPFATRLEKANEIIELASARNLLICPVHQFPFQSGIRRIMDRKKDLGTILLVRMVICSVGASGLDEKSVHDVIAEISPHFVSIKNCLIPGTGEGYDWQVRGLALGGLLLESKFRDGVFQGYISMSGRPTRNYVEIIGTHGSAFSDLFQGYSIIQKGGAGRLHKILHPFNRSCMHVGASFLTLARRSFAREWAYPGLHDLIREFYKCFAEELPAPIPSDEIREAAYLTEKICQLNMVDSEAR